MGCVVSIAHIPLNGILIDLSALKQEKNTSDFLVQFLTALSVSAVHHAVCSKCSLPGHLSLVPKNQKLMTVDIRHSEE